MKVMNALLKLFKLSKSFILLSLSLLLCSCESYDTLSTAFNEKYITKSTQESKDTYINPLYNNWKVVSTDNALYVNITLKPDNTLILKDSKGDIFTGTFLLEGIDTTVDDSDIDAKLTITYFIDANKEKPIEVTKTYNVYHDLTSKETLTLVDQYNMRTVLERNDE